MPVRGRSGWPYGLCAVAVRAVRSYGTHGNDAHRMPPRTRTCLVSLVSPPPASPEDTRPPPASPEDTRRAGTGSSRSGRPVHLLLPLCEVLVMKYFTNLDIGALE